MIVFALRHADRAGTADALSPAGVKRAELLARLLGESGVSVAFCSDTVRAHQTLAPLEARLGIVANEIALAGLADADNHARKVVKALRDLPPQTVAVVVGHDATTDKVVKKLTEATVVINGDEFDKLFVISVCAGGSMVAMMRYGDPTP